jgi:Zn finger protein HypA/HybF involved in hydrogenase expression
VACDKCETTWVSASTGTGTHGQVTAIQKHKMMECPECRNEATKILQSGKTLQPGEVVHKCASCGGTMTACEVH